MTWLSSILVGLGLGAASTLLGGLVAAQASRWLRVTTREGYAGYWTVFMALLAGLYGFLCGLATSRIMGDFAPAIGVAAALAVGGIALAGLLARLFGSSESSFQNKALSLDIEVRSPVDAAPIGGDPTAFHGYLAGKREDRAAVSLDYGSRRREDRRSVVPGRVALRTRKVGVYLVFTGQRLNQATVYFRLESATVLALAEGAWSPWLPGSPPGDLQPTSDAADFELRVRRRAPER